MELNKKEKLRQYYKKYYIDNKQKYKDYNKRISQHKILCEVCNCHLVKKHIKAHYRTDKHAKNIINYDGEIKQEENKNRIL